ncbi:MAG: DUF1566 domain-containing protein [Deltaproteobacteria bacterium]|nr:DUF1566 domain-containing protein [Deltaproteobacteria bacterium]
MRNIFRAFWNTSFLLCAAFALNLSLGDQAEAARPGWVARTLKANQRVSIYPYRCKLKLHSSSFSEAQVRCSAPSKRFTTLPVGRPYLRAKQSATIKAKSCLLEVVTSSSALVRLRCLPLAPLSITATSLSLVVNGSADSYVVTNNSTTMTATNIQATLPAGWSDVTQDSSSCTSLPPAASCLLFFTPGSSTHAAAEIEVKGENTTTVTAQLSVDSDSSTTIASSVNNLAVSVNNPGLNSALTGTPRTIIITNTGSTAAVAISINASPALPTGTTLSNNCANLAAAATCIVTITPGNTPSAAPADTNPSPIVLTINGSNTNTLTPNLNILSYGSVYQGGYVFAIDDTTPSTGSIGGKVVALTDQSSGIVWDPGCPGSCTGSISANSSLDGAANSAAILTSLSSLYSSTAYASGLCAQVIAGYSDWYLPAICEMGYESSVSAACGDVSAPTLQNIQSSLVDSSLLPLTTFYWSSTQNSGSPNTFANMSFFSTPGVQPTDSKDIPYAVRCVRGMTL